VPLTLEGPTGQCAVFRPAGCDIFPATGAPDARMTAWPWCWRRGSGMGEWADHTNGWSRKKHARREH
jgi:hypothetical protein